MTGECKLAPLAEFNDPLATTSGLNDAEKTGYYTFTALAQDKAGNRSEEIVRTAVNDDDAPNAGVIVGAYAKGAYSLTVTLTDNLSINAYWAETRFAAADGALQLGTVSIDEGFFLPREGGVAVDDYNVDGDLSDSKLEPSFKVLTFRGLQPTAGGEQITELVSIGVKATDHGGRNSGDNGIVTFSPALDLDGDGFLVRDATTFEFAAQDADDAPAYDEVFQSFSAEDTSVEDDVIELRAEIVGTVGYEAATAAVTGDLDADPVVPDVAAEDGMEGLVNNPVSRVDFYAAVLLRDVSSTNAVDRLPPVPYGTGTEALVFIGTVTAAGAVDFVDADNNEEASRKYVWGIDVSRADFLAAVGGDADGDYTTGNIIAFAVNSDGVALYSAPVTSVTVDK